MTHLTRERGSLAHDDRIACRAAAVSQWADVLGKDVDTEVQKREDKAMALELRNWRKRAGLHNKPQGIMGRMRR